MKNNNPYIKCPVYETDNFIIRQVKESDAEDLLCCYSDPNSRELFNSDNCTSDFVYTNLNDMANCIDFWLDQYKDQYYVRFSIIDKAINKAIGTIEIFNRGTLNNVHEVGILRLDLSSNYENNEHLEEIFKMVNENFYEDFGLENILTKAIPKAANRIGILKALGYSFVDNHDLLPYNDYFIRTRKSTAYLYVFDTMADWEASYLTAELRSGRHFKKGLQPFKVVTIGNTKAPIVTMGGLKIIPDIQIDECNLDDAAVLILPGGDTWTEQIHAPILSIAEKCLNNGTVVAAICGATFGLAQAGMLNQRQHTSNDLEYLKMVCPNYIGEKYYKQESAVTDENLITAPGVAALDFTVHVLKKLDVFSPKALDLWYKLYSTSNPKFFFELMSAIQ